MESEKNFSEAVEKIIQQDTRYARGAYYFLREGLDFTVKNLKEKPGRKRQSDGNVANHVTAQELLDGLRDYALEQFGPMSATLLSQWGLSEAAHIGDVVFNLVEARVFGKTDSDTREDFKNCHDFADNLRAPFQPRPDTILMLKKALAEASEETKNENETFRNITEKVFGDMQALVASMKAAAPKKKRKSKSGDRVDSNGSNDADGGNAANDVGAATDSDDSADANSGNGDDGFVESTKAASAAGEDDDVDGNNDGDDTGSTDSGAELASEDTGQLSNASTKDRIDKGTSPLRAITAPAMPVLTTSPRSVPTAPAKEKPSKEKSEKANPAKEKTGNAEKAALAKEKSAKSASSKAGKAKSVEKQTSVLVPKSASGSAEKPVPNSRSKSAPPKATVAASASANAKPVKSASGKNAPVSLPQVGKPASEKASVPAKSKTASAKVSAKSKKTVPALRPAKPGKK